MMSTPSWPAAVFLRAVALWQLRLESFLAVPGGCTVSAATADCHSADDDGPAAVFEHQGCAGCDPQAPPVCPRRPCVRQCM